VIEAALITAPTRSTDLIFGRPLLERLIILCRRAGIQRFLVEAPEPVHESVRTGLGRFRDDPAIDIVSAFSAHALPASFDLDPSSRCVKFLGNLVLHQSQLRRVLSQSAGRPGEPLCMYTADTEQGGMIMVGALKDLTTDGLPLPSPLIAGGTLPFALNGRPADREEAELRLARAVRDESVSTDSLMARAFDRRISWRISLPLARAKVAPNVVTLANTALGFGCAAMLASTSYWLRLTGALLFLVSITLDGVDGELARLRMVESKFGGKLDVLTDNLVHIGIFTGIMIGCFRTSQSDAYLYLSLLLLVGFGLCAVSVNRALGVSSEAASRWISRVERATGRDFAYLVVIFTAINRLNWFAWGVSFGSYIFAAVLWRLTSRRLRHGDDATSHAQAKKPAN
jgi:phosphatidylglycerophosphate synthase